MRKIIVSFSLLSLIMFLGISTIWGAAETPTGGTIGQGPDTMAKIVTMIENVAKWFTIVILMVAIIMLLYAGLLWMTAGGDEEKIKSARTTFIYALVGIFTAILAWTIVSVVKSVIGVTTT